jgi:hypothetical protein
MMMVVPRDAWHPYKPGFACAQRTQNRAVELTFITVTNGDIGSVS